MGRIELGVVRLREAGVGRPRGRGRLSLRDSPGLVVEASVLAHNGTRVINSRHHQPLADSYVLFGVASL
jgi:hypothetical protein